MGSKKTQFTKNRMIIISIVIICGEIENAFAISQTPYGSLPLDGLSPYLPSVQWTGGQFHFPCPSTKTLYKNSGKYISKNVIATRAQIVRDTVFLALPRYKSGIPATLVKTAIKPGTCQTILTPFPCWSLQEEGNCKALQSVVDLVVDPLDILWVLDTGIVNTLETPIRRCPPKVVAFHIKSGRVLKTIDLSGLTNPKSRLQYLAVDYSLDGCCYLYVSDAANRAIIVYNIQDDQGFRIVLPKAVTSGCNKKDVLYMALTRKTCGSTVLYFTYFGSRRMYSIKTEHLRSGSTEGRVVDVGLKPAKIVIIGTDNGSAIFFRYEGEAEVYRWDTTSCFTAPNFKVVYRCPTCQLATHAMPDYRRNTMRVLQSNFPDYMQNTVGCGAIQQLAIMQGCW